MLRPKRLQTERLLLAIARERYRVALHGQPFGGWLQRTPRVTTRTAPELVRASSRLSQGRWLASLAALAAERAGARPIQVLELGTCAGVSGMYLLAGMSEVAGGHLVTFEGDAQLAALAEQAMSALISRRRLRGVTFEVRVGRFETTVLEFFRALERPLDLAFVDGNHREEPTLEYHRLARERMSPRGIIVHDDIAWSAEMTRAWSRIKEAESCKLTELMLGGRPSRGVVWLGEPAGGGVERHDLDSAVERWLRRAVRGASR